MCIGRFFSSNILFKTNVWQSIVFILPVYLVVWKIVLFVLGSSCVSASSRCPHRWGSLIHV
jgi:hypothetical protein